MNYKGVIIEESLENKGILKELAILATKVEQVTENHKTPWLKQWTLCTVEIAERTNRGRFSFTEPDTQKRYPK